MTRTPLDVESIIREISQHRELGGLEPRADQLRRLLVDDPAGPLQFVNLLAYHPVARYPDGHPMASKGLTGAQAYGLYGQVAVRHVTQRGGRLTMFNDVVQAVIGDEAWHQVAVMEYRDVAAFVDMLRDPDYQAGLVHRDAGLARTAVLATRSLLRPGG